MSSAEGLGGDGAELFRLGIRRGAHQSLGRRFLPVYIVFLCGGTQREGQLVMRSDFNASTTRHN